MATQLFRSLPGLSLGRISAAPFGSERKAFSRPARPPGVDVAPWDPPLSWPAPHSPTSLPHAPSPPCLLGPSPASFLPVTHPHQHTSSQHTWSMCFCLHIGEKSVRVVPTLIRLTRKGSHTARLQGLRDATSAHSALAATSDRTAKRVFRSVSKL